MDGSRSATTASPPPHDIRGYFTCCRCRNSHRNGSRRDKGPPFTSPSVRAAATDPQHCRPWPTGRIFCIARLPLILHFLIVINDQPSRDTTRLRPPVNASPPHPLTIKLRPQIVLHHPVERIPQHALMQSPNQITKKTAPIRRLFAIPRHYRGIVLTKVNRRVQRSTPSHPAAHWARACDAPVHRARRGRTTP